MVIQFYCYHLLVQKLRASMMRQTYLLRRLYMVANNDKISFMGWMYKSIISCFSYSSSWYYLKNCFAVASRRTCEDIIFDARVTVNGEVCKIPQVKKLSLSCKEMKYSVHIPSKGVIVMWPWKWLVNKPCCEPCSYQTKRHMRIVLGSFWVDDFEKYESS